MPLRFKFKYADGGCVIARGRNWTPRARYRAMLGMGYTDAFRSLHVGEIGHFTFWDYFRQAFQNNRGIRIDHFLLSPTLADRLESCEIDKGPRGQEKPSDHTLMIVTLSDLP
jgi:exodeoxyribonuclease-3